MMNKAQKKVIEVKVTSDVYGFALNLAEVQEAEAERCRDMHLKELEENPEHTSLYYLERAEESEIEAKALRELAEKIYKLM